MNAKLEDYFILGPITTNGIFQRQFRCLLKSARHCTHYYRSSASMRHWWAFVTDVPSGSTFHPSQTGMASRSGQCVTSVLTTCTTCRYTLERWAQQHGARVVRDPATLVYGSTRNITTDNFFTSHALAKFLLGLNLTLLGTVRKTRKELPSEFVLKKLTSLESVFAFTEDTTSRTPQNKQDYCRAGADHSEPPPPTGGTVVKGPHHGEKGGGWKSLISSGRPYRLA